MSILDRPFTGVRGLFLFTPSGGNHPGKVRGLFLACSGFFVADFQNAFGIDSGRGEKKPCRLGERRIINVLRVNPALSEASSRIIGFRTSIAPSVFLVI